MTLTFTRCAARAARAVRACAIGICLALVAFTSTQAKERKESAPAEDSPFPDSRSLAEEIPRGEESDEGPDDSEFLDPKAADFDEWEPIVEQDAKEPLLGGETSDGESDKHELRPIDWMRHWGLRHSSTDGRFVDKNVALIHSSWLNRPYHVDWFVGPLLSDNLVEDRVRQSNEIFGGLRAGWDFDYYWGLEWRFGWADPQIFNDGETEGLSGRYFVSDLDFIYYPWGDTKVRPYFQWGLGVTEVGSVHEDGAGNEAMLLGMPFGIGLQFPQTRWLAWRLEIIDNLAFGNDGVDTMHNVAFTAGMEMRLGARPNSYWPWRSSRRIW